MTAMSGAHFFFLLCVIGIVLLCFTYKIISMLLILEEVCKPNNPFYGVLILKYFIIRKTINAVTKKSITLARTLP